MIEKFWPKYNKLFDCPTNIIFIYNIYNIIYIFIYNKIHNKGLYNQKDIGGALTIKALPFY